MMAKSKKSDTTTYATMTGTADAAEDQYGNGNSFLRTTG
jgi:hypothetical protein